MNKHHGSTLESLFEELGELDELRALVRDVLLEDEAVVKKWAVAHGNPIERALAEKDIVPLFRGADQTSELGAGQNNVVLDVLYKGKRAVARISDNPNEPRSLLDFVAQAGKLPAKYKKHFPKIFTTFDLNVEKQHYYGAVVEMLDPLPPGLEFDLDYQSYKGNVQRARVAALMNDNWIVEGIIEDATAIRGVQAELLRMYEESIRPKLLSWVNKPLDDFDEWLDSIVTKHANNAKYPRAYVNFERGVMQALKSAVIPYEPTDSKLNSRMSETHASKQVRDFYEFLQALENAGTKWGDLHTGNFMMRRQTGDFVVVDPGYFDSGNKESGSRSFDPPSDRSFSGT